MAVTPTTTVESNTYTFTNAEYTTWANNGSPTANLSSTNLRANTSVNDPFFEFFYCGGSRDSQFTCYKYQPIAGTDGDPRFDTTTAGANAVLFKSSGTGGAITTTALGTLTGAFDSFGGADVMAYALVYFFLCWY